MTPKSCLVKDYMSRTLITFKPDTDVLDAVHTLVKHRRAGVSGVDDAGNLVGMLSEFDCMKVVLDASYHDRWGGPVKDYMTTDTATVSSHMNIIDLAQEFEKRGFRRFPVLEDNRLVGQISRRDVLRALQEIAQA